VGPSDIVLITIDALRADHMSAYGYARRTTRNLDALASRSIKFERAYTPTPHTSLAMGSLLTGRSIWSSLRLMPERTFATLPELLHGAGYRSAAFYPPATFFTEGARLQSYARSRFGFEHAEVDYFDAMQAVERTIAFLERSAKEPGPNDRRFVWLHLFEPHEPYLLHPAFSFGQTDLDRYDSEIAYTDFAIGHLLDYLERKRPDTIIVMTADHGEAFDEHGDRYHGTSLYDEQVRVPLILKLPGVSAGTVHMPVSLLDVAPTLLALAGVPPQRELPGQALISPLDGSVQLGHRPVFAELDHLRMVVSGNQKLLCNVTWGGCMLHDLVLDPGELKDGSSGAAETLPALRAELNHLLTEQAATFAQRFDSPDPRWALIGRAQLGDGTMATALKALLAPSVPLALRRAAARGLSAMHVPLHAAPALKKALRDSDAETAGWAAAAALTLQLRGAQTVARSLLGKPAPSAELRTALALALGEQGDRAALPLLLQALPGCEEPLRCQRIVRVLGALRDTRAVPGLLDALPRLDVRREVVDALGELADPAALQPLISCLLQDMYVPVRVAAARALGKLQAPSARQALLQAAELDTEAVVVSEARLAASRLRADR
jgi:arylsulfatase A-like enzyme